MKSVHTPSGVLMEMGYNWAVGLGLIPAQVKVAVYGRTRQSLEF